MMRPTAISSTGTLTTMSQDSWMSCCRAMMTPPIARIGAETSRVQVISTSICTCCTSFVLRVMSDGAPNFDDLALRELAHLAEDRAAQVAADAHRDPRAEVDGGDRAGDLHERDAEHPGADPEDVVGVALDDAVVDDVGVEGRQLQRQHRLCRAGRR